MINYRDSPPGTVYTEAASLKRRHVADDDVDVLQPSEKLVRRNGSLAGLGSRFISLEGPPPALFSDGDGESVHADRGRRHHDVRAMSDSPEDMVIDQLRRDKTGSDQAPPKATDKIPAGRQASTASARKTPIEGTYGNGRSVQRDAKVRDHSQRGRGHQSFDDGHPHSREDQDAGKYEQREHRHDGLRGDWHNNHRPPYAVRGYDHSGHHDDARDGPTNWEAGPRPERPDKGSEPMGLRQRGRCAVRDERRDG